MKRVKARPAFAAHPTVPADQPQDRPVYTKSRTRPTLAGPRLDVHPTSQQSGESHEQQCQQGGACVDLRIRRGARRLRQHPARCQHLRARRVGRGAERGMGNDRGGARRGDRERAPPHQRHPRGRVHRAPGVGQVDRGRAAGFGGRLPRRRPLISASADTAPSPPRRSTNCY